MTASAADTNSSRGPAALDSTASTACAGKRDAQHPTVYFDGACPLCRREIDFYRRRPGAERLIWVDVASADRPAPDLSREDALARFHVRLPDGRLAVGALGFAAMWRALPGWRWLGRLVSAPGVAAVSEVAYRTFLVLRPLLQGLARPQASGPYALWPRWIERELRSNHAGEVGAVAIYRGILTTGRDAAVRAFATRHLRTERTHVEIMEALLTPERRSRLLALWRAGGFVTGALAAVFGPRAVYATVAAVESFVDDHYGAQIDALAGHPRYRALRATLQACRDDELAHRDEARALGGAAGGAGPGLWLWAVGLGSQAAAALARRL